MTDPRYIALTRRAENMIGERNIAVAKLKGVTQLVLDQMQKSPYKAGSSQHTAYANACITISEQLLASISADPLTCEMFGVGRISARNTS